MALSIALEMVSLSMRREIHQNPKIGVCLYSTVRDALVMIVMSLGCDKERGKFRSCICVI